MPSGWEKPLHTAVFFLLVCHFTLLSSKVPNQTAADANPFSLPDPDASEAAGADAAASVPAQAAAAPQGSPPQGSQPQGEEASAPPPQLFDAPAAPARVVLQSTLAADARAAAVFAGQPGWAPPASNAVTPKLRALSFDGAGPGIPSPVCFTNLPGAAVRTVILAARGSAADLATLVDAPETARLRIAREGGAEPGMTAAERSLAEQFSPGQWRVFEIGFSRDTPLAGLFFGGSAGRPEWARNWRGEIAEAVCFGAPPDADTRAGVAHYLALRWGIAGVPPATAAQRQAAAGAGLHCGLVWATVFIVK
jgi:hypothetical protein